MDEKEIMVTLTKKELDEILGNLPGLIKELEKEIKEEESVID